MKKSNRGKNKSESAMFFRITQREKESGHVILEVYKLRAAGNAYKVDKLFLENKDFTEPVLYKMMAEKHGAGAYKIRHYNAATPTGYSLFQVIIKGQNDSGSLNDENIIKSREERIKELETQNLKLQSEMLQAKNQGALIQMQILEAQNRMQLETRRAELEIKRLENEISEESGGGIFQKLLDAVQDPSHPLGKITIGILSNMAAKASDKKPAAQPIEKKGN